MAVSVMAVMSCTKDNVSVTLQKEVIDRIEDMIPVSFDVEAPALPGADGTKVSHTADGTLHSFAWEEGDSFSMFGYISQCTETSHNGTFHNFSANPFVYDGSKFFGYFPNVREIYGTGSKAKLNYLGVYPAAIVELDEVTSKPSSNEYYVNVEGCTIASTQDGTGFPYCIFYCKSGGLDERYMSICTNAANSPKFILGNLVLRMSLESSKDITKVELSTDASYLVGDVTKLQYTGIFQINRGCATKTLTVCRDGEALPKDLYMAIRVMAKDKTYTFKFTAADGTTFTKVLYAQAQQEKTIVNLGTVSIPDESWE